MFGLFGGGKGSTAANSRVKRAQQLRQQRLAAARRGGSSPTKASSHASDDDDEVLVVSGLCTILCGFLIVCLGAAMATLFFMIHQPECLKGITTDASFGAPSNGQLRRLQKETPERNVEPTEAVESPMLAEKDEFMPPQCTPEQLDRLAVQLPPKGCVDNQDKPWKRLKCSFSAATSCNDASWFRNHYAKKSVEKFAE